MTITIRFSETFTTWLSSLTDLTAKARIDTRLARAQMGLMGDVKPVGAGVSELRIDYGPGYRLYFGQRGRQMIVILVGGDKSSQSADIRLAKKLWLEMKEG